MQQGDERFPDYMRIIQDLIGESGSADSTRVRQRIKIDTGTSLRNLVSQPSFYRAINLPIKLSFPDLPNEIILRYPRDILNQINRLLVDEDHLPADFILEDFYTSLVGESNTDTVDNVSTEIADFFQDRYADDEGGEAPPPARQMPVIDALYSFYEELIDEAEHHLGDENLNCYKFVQLIDHDAYLLRRYR